MNSPARLDDYRARCAGSVLALIVVGTAVIAAQLPADATVRGLHSYGTTHAVAHPASSPSLVVQGPPDLPAPIGPTDLEPVASGAMWLDLDGALYRRACVEAGGTAVRGLVAGADVDSLTAVANTRAINTALGWSYDGWFRPRSLAQASVCLPASDPSAATGGEAVPFRLGYDYGPDAVWPNGAGYAAGVVQSFVRPVALSTSIVGAGDCTSPDAPCTRLLADATPREHAGPIYLGRPGYARWNSLGFHRAAYGWRGPIDSLVVRGVWFDGGKAHTGDYRWRGNSAVLGDAWDVSHKGVHLGGGGNMTAYVEVGTCDADGDPSGQGVQISGHLGEQQYRGGYNLGTFVSCGTRVHDGNASAFNVAHARVMRVRQFTWGPSIRFGSELTPARAPTDALFEDGLVIAGDGAFTFAQGGDVPQGEESTWTLRRVRFVNAGSDRVLSDDEPYGGTANVVQLTKGRWSLTLEDNTFEGFGRWFSTFSGRNDGPTTLVATGNVSDGGLGLLNHAWLVGTVSGNAFAAPEGASVDFYTSWGLDSRGLVVEDNDVTGFRVPSTRGDRTVGLPLTRGNRFEWADASWVNARTEGLVASADHVPLDVRERGLPPLPVLANVPDGQTTTFSVLPGRPPVTVSGESTCSGEDVEVAPGAPVPLRFDADADCWSDIDD